MVIPYKFIAIEGVVGVGKTFLSTLLARRWNSRLILEDVDNIPLLSKFYSNQEKYSFQLQMSFLSHRFKQLSTLKRSDLFYKHTIADYFFDKNVVFSRVNLSSSEEKLHRIKYDLMAESLPCIDLVIFLECSISCLLERIAMRSRPYEKNISKDYLLRLQDAYAQYMCFYKTAPIITINTDHISFLSDEDSIRNLEKLLTASHIPAQNNLRLSFV